MGQLTWRLWPDGHARFSEIKRSVNALYNGDGAVETIKIPIGARGINHEVSANVIGFHLDWNFRITGITLEFDPILTDAGPTGSSFIVDINKTAIDGSNPVSILKTKLSVDAGEYHSNTATIPVVTSLSKLAQYEFISIDVDQIGSTLAGKDGFVTLKGYRI